MTEKSFMSNLASVQNAMRTGGISDIVLSPVYDGRLELSFRMRSVNPGNPMEHTAPLKGAWDGEGEARIENAAAWLVRNTLSTFPEATVILGGGAQMIIPDTGMPRIEGGPPYQFSAMAS